MTPLVLGSNLGGSVLLLKPLARVCVEQRHRRFQIPYINTPRDYGYLFRQHIARTASTRMNLLCKLEKLLAGARQLAIDDNRRSEFLGQKVETLLHTRSFIAEQFSALC